MYKVIIIDDEKAAIETLRRDLEVQADLEIKGTAGNGAKGKMSSYLLYFHLYPLLSDKLHPVLHRLLHLIL